MKKPLAIAVFCALGAVILGLGAYAWSLDSRLAEAGYISDARGSSAASELAGALAALDGALGEANYAADSALQSALCAEAAASAASAVTALAGLPCATEELETLARYINGAGDYALSLSRDCAAGRSLTEAERESLAELGAAVSRISADIGGIFAALDAGELCLDGYGGRPGGAEGTLGAALAELDAALGEFPALEYDGVYGRAAAEPAYIAAMEPVTESAARQKAADFLGVERSALAPEGLTGGEIPCYAFSGGGARVTVTERGGVVLAVSGACSGGEAAVGAEEAGRAARSFIAARLPGEFAEVGAAERAGGYDFTFAPLSAEGVLLLPDAVSLTVDAATGEVCAYDAAGYVMNHTDRGALAPEVDRDTAAARVNPALTIEAARLVLDETDGGNEALCWEFACSNGDGERVFVSVDAKMGRECKIALA